METKWQCQFKDPPKSITVGDKLLLLCDGEARKNLQKPIRIEFLDGKRNYSLHVLKTLRTEERFLALEVTSYQTGAFNHPFKITDGKQSLVIDNLSFAVQSVLKETKKQPKPHGSFGPFKPPLPIPHLTAILLTLLFATGAFLIFLNRAIKRKKYIQKILNRKTYFNPSKSFILGLRQKTKNSDYSGQKLEELFKQFLEDLFFIPAIDKTTEQIMKSLKQYHFPVYKKEGPDLRQLLNELSSLNQKTKFKKTFHKMKKVCQDMVFLLDNQRK